MGKIKFFRSLEIGGILFILFGMTLWFTGAEILNIPFIRMDLVPIGFGFIGVILFIAASSAISYEKNKTAEQEIEEQDERMIQIHQHAKSKAFDIIAGVFPIVLLGMAMFGYMTKVSFFTLAGLYLICVMIYYYQLKLNEKKM